MGCYIVPAVAALVTYVMRRKKPSIGRNSQYLWLNLLFAGGAMFGVIDHLWNGELFMLGEKPLMDVALGVTITAVILFAWKMLVIYDGFSKKAPEKVMN
jgi:uncharacterized membrane protein YoaK (UPF0700 family)